MKGVVEKMGENSTAVDVMIGDVEHYQELTFGGKKIAYFLALQSFLHHTSLMLPAHQSIEWLRMELDGALEKFDTGKACTLGEAFGIPDRTERDAEVLQGRNEERNYPWDRKYVGRYLHEHKVEFEKDLKKAVENLGRAVVGRLRKDSSTEIPTGLAQQHGCKAYLLYPYEMYGTRAAAIELYSRIKKEPAIRKLVDEIFGRNRNKVVADWFGVGSTKLDTWYYDYLKMDTFWRVHHLVRDLGVGPQKAIAQVAKETHKRRDLIEKWYKAGHDLVMHQI